MPTQVLIPPLGQTVDTLVFVSWYKQEGELVHQGEPLFVVETDKATLDVEAPASGLLRQVTVRPGDEVRTLSVIAVIVAENELADSETTYEFHRDPSPQMAQDDISEVLVPSSSRRAGSETQGGSKFPQLPTRLFASPRARRLAEHLGVPLSELTGTGPEGAIVERDVRAAVRRQEVRGKEVRELKEGRISPVAQRLAEEAGLDWHALAGTGPRGQIIRQDVEHALAQAISIELALPVVPSVQLSARSTDTPLTAPHPLASDTLASGTLTSGTLTSDTLTSGTPTSDILDILPLRSVRALIAERMQTSHRETAPVTLTAEVDATELVEMRKRLAEQGVVVSYNDLLITILARALREHPRLNASLDGDAIKQWRRVDIGLAVDTDRGLVVPVVRDADQKGLAHLAQETEDLAERARSGRITPDELRGGTFTLTNLGMLGIDAFTPMINLPETAILGAGRIKEKPAVVAGQVAIRSLMWLSLTFDHRLVDGGPAARFLQRVTQLVEQPVLLLA